MVGCAGTKESASTPPQAAAEPTEDSTEGSSGLAIPPAAARIYMLGETRYAEGRFDEAVALWGHTLLQLPADPAADHLRHKLVARMGFGLLQAHQVTGDTSYLEDGQQMCEVYVAKHEQLFGDGDDARAERGEIYELLYEFDSRLDGMEEELLEGDEMEEESSEPAMPPTTVAAAPSRSTSPEDGNDYRLINVRRIAWANPDDPRVRAFARDGRFTGPSKLDTGRENVHESRVLVRVGEVPRPTENASSGTTRKRARQAGLAVVEAARPALERCYEVAMTRDPVLAARVAVTLTVNTDGTIATPRLVDGMVVDAEGDACVAEVLRQTKVDASLVPDTLALSMPIHFFYQDATIAAELLRIEQTVGEGMSEGYTRTGRASGLPPINAFAIGREPYTRPDPAKGRVGGVNQLDPDQQERTRFPR